MKENVKVMYRITFPSEKYLKYHRKKKLALKTVTIKKVSLKVKQQSLLLYKVGATFYMNRACYM